MYKLTVTRADRTKRTYWNLPSLAAAEQRSASLDGAVVETEIKEQTEAESAPPAWQTFFSRHAVSSS